MEKVKRIGNGMLKRIPVIGKKIQTLKQAVQTIGLLTDRMSMMQKELDTLKKENERLNVRISALSPKLASTAAEMRSDALRETSFYQAYQKEAIADVKNRLKTVLPTLTEVIEYEKETEGHTVHVLSLGQDYGFWNEAGKNAQAETILTILSGHERIWADSKQQSIVIQSPPRDYLFGCADSSLQVISSFFFLEDQTVENAWEMLQEMYRILRPLGRIVILQKHQMQVCPYMDSRLSSICGCISPNLQELMIREAGFTDVEIVGKEAICMMTARKPGED